MKTLLMAGAVALAAWGGTAAAQTTYDQRTTTRTVQPVAPVAPPPGTLSTTRTTRTVDPSGNETREQSSTYRDGSGVTRESETRTRTVQPVPPPVSTTTTTRSTTTTGE